MELDKIIKERYSVRNFSNKEVEAEKISKLLETLNYIPTATNAQPEKVYILKSKESIEKINKVANTYGAPLVLVICTDMNIVWKNPKEEGYTTSEMDSSIVGTYLMLKAHDLDLESVWIRLFNSNEVKKELNLEDNIKPICILALGYKSDNSTPTQNHYNKKPLEELIKYI